MSLGGCKVLNLPLGFSDAGIIKDEVEIRAMTGVEEEILTDENLSLSDRLNKMVTGCLNRIGDVTDKEKIAQMFGKLGVEDQTVILIGLRAISVGETYSYDVICPSCTAPSTINLDLSSLKIEESPAKKNPVTEVTLPSGAKAKIKPLLVEDIKRVEKELLRVENDSAKASVVIMVRLLELNGKVNPDLEDVRQMLFGDRVFIRGMFDKLEGGVETELYVKCEKCGSVFRSLLDIGRLEFFMPRMPV